MRAESFRRLLVARIDGDESLAVKLVDDEVIEVAFIAAGAANARVGVANSGQIQRLKEQIIFAMEVGFPNDVLEIIEKRETNLGSAT